MKQRKKSFGMRISAFVLSFAMVCTLLAGVNVVAFAADDLDDTVSVQKFYFDATKGGNGEHIYTVDEDEISWYKSLPSWNDEGEAWKAPLFSEVPVYRVANYNTGEHLWITDKGYVDYLVGLGWTQEQGVAFYSDENMGVPVYRLWNGTDGVGSHHFTTNEEEIAWLESIGWKNEGPQFYGVKEEEPSELEITALQTGASEVTVSIDTDYVATLLDDVVLTRGKNVVDGSVSVSDDGKVITITTDSELATDEYAVTVTPADETVEPATDVFEAEAAKLSAIAFASDKLVLTSSKAFNEAAAPIRGFNQFMEPEILDQGTVKCYSAYTAGDGTEYIQNQGGIVMFSTTGSQIFTVGTTIPATAVYDDGNGNVLQTQATLTVSNAQAIESFTFGEIGTTDVKLIGERVTHKGLKGGKYYIPVTAKDQYGNTLTKDMLNKMYLVDNALLIAPDGTNQCFAYVSGFDELDDGTVVANIRDGGLSYPGTATLSFVSVGGTTATASFEIDDERWIDDLEVSVPELYIGEPAILEITATDQYGEEFTDEELYEMYNDKGGATAKQVTFGDVNALTTKGSSLSVTQGTFSVVANPVKKNVVVKYTPVTGMDKTPDNMIVTTATPNATYKSLTAKSAATPAGISGLKSTVETVLGGNTGDIDLGDKSNIIFTDSYGNTVKATDANYPTYFGTTAPTAAAGDGFYYTVVCKTYTGVPAGGKYTYNNAGKIESIEPATTGGAINVRDGGSDKYEITLYQVDSTATTQKVKSLATKTVTATVSSQDYKSFVAGFANPLTKTPKTNFYIGDNTWGNDLAVLTVYGIDKEGNMVALGDNAEYTAVLRNEKIGAAQISLSATGMLTCTTGTTVETTVEDAYVDVYENISGNDKLVATATITCMDAIPETVMFAATLNGDPVDISNGITIPSETAASAKAYSFAKGAVNPLDPTGNTRFAGDTVVITDYNGATYTYVYAIVALDQYGMSYIEKAMFGGQDFTGLGVGGAKSVTAGGTLSLASDSVSLVTSISQ